jgi:hypothetical protein
MQVTLSSQNIVDFITSHGIPYKADTVPVLPEMSMS